MELNFREKKIKTSDKVQFLGITTDQRLPFEQRIYEICRKASGQLNAPKRSAPIFQLKHAKQLLMRLFYLLTNWLAYLYGRIQSPRPHVMPDRREGITRAAGFGFVCIDTQAS